MKAYFSVFNFLLVVLSFVFFLFSTSNNAFATHDIPAGCTFKGSFIISYCGQSGSLCGPSKFLNKACTGAGKDNTGDSCCTKVIETQLGTGIFYDSCSAHPFLNPTVCSDAIQLPGQELYCCLNPTPTL